MKVKFTRLAVAMIMTSLLIVAVQAQEETPESTPMPEATEMDLSEEPISLDTITDDPDVYYGQTVTLQDNIVEALAPRIFVMERQQLLQSDRLLVVYNTDSIEGFDIVQIANNDLEARVTGTLEQFILGDIYDQYTPDLDFDLFQETFGDYEGNAVLIADSVNIVDEVDPDDIEETDIHDVLDNPTALMDQEVTIQEQLVEYIAPNIYKIEDKDFFNPADLIVIYTVDDAVNGLPVIELADQDPEVVVTGTVRNFDLLGLEQEYGVDFDDEVYSSYEGPVLIASSIVLSEEVDTSEMNDGMDVTADPNMDVDTGANVEIVVTPTP